MRKESKQRAEEDIKRRGRFWGGMVRWVRAAEQHLYQGVHVIASTRLESSSSICRSVHRIVLVGEANAVVSSVGCETMYCWISRAARTALGPLSSSNATSFGTMMLPYGIKHVFPLSPQASFRVSRRNDAPRSKVLSLHMHKRLDIAPLR